MTAWVVKEEDEERAILEGCVVLEAADKWTSLIVVPEEVCAATEVTLCFEQSFMWSLRQLVLCKNFPQLMHLEGFDLVSNSELQDWQELLDVAEIFEAEEQEEEALRIAALVFLIEKFSPLQVP